jgi:hypothetical protein
LRSIAFRAVPLLLDCRRFNSQFEVYVFIVIYISFVPLLLNVWLLLPASCAFFSGVFHFLPRTAGLGVRFRFSTGVGSAHWCTRVASQVCRFTPQCLFTLHLLGPLLRVTPFTSHICVRLLLNFMLNPALHISSDARERETKLASDFSFTGLLCMGRPARQPAPPQPAPTCPADLSRPPCPVRPEVWRLPPSCFPMRQHPLQIQSLHVAFSVSVPSPSRAPGHPWAPAGRPRAPAFFGLVLYRYGPTNLQQML